MTDDKKRYYLTPGGWKEDRPMLGMRSPRFVLGAMAAIAVVVLVYEALK